MKEAVQEGVQPVLDLLKEYDDVNNAFADPEVPKTLTRWKNSSAARLNFKTSSMLAMHGTSTINSNALWMLFAAHPTTRKLRCFPVANAVAWLFAASFFEQPDILLLDEPTNHLDAESIDWLEQHLQQYPGTVIAVTHDRYFLDHVAGWILATRPRRRNSLKGNYSSWLDQKTKRMAQEEKQASKRRKTLERELNGCVWRPRHDRLKERLVCRATTAY